MKLYAVTVDGDTGIPSIEAFEVLKRTRDGGYIIDDGCGRIRIGKDLMHDNYDDLYLRVEDAQKEAIELIKDELAELKANSYVFEKELCKYDTSLVHPDTELRPRHRDAKSNLLCEGAGI